MNITKITKYAVLVGALSITSAGVAFADSTQVGDTGPDSTNNVSITVVNTVNATNDNHIVIVNNNDQESTSGNANVSGNTNGGSATSGSTSNSSVTTTMVGLVNGASVVVPGGGGNGGNNGGNPGSGGAGGSSAPASNQLSYAGGNSVGTLPRTGPLGIVDVSALRNLYQPKSDLTPTQNPVLSKTQGVSRGLFVLAAILTLAGTVGSVKYATKRTAKV